MESTPLFSVLCVCWNGGAFLAEGIRSVLRQSESSLELILVDDHSTDTTWEIMSAAAKEDPRVVILRNPTKGKVAGFNAAVALSKGQWIHLLGGDDMLAPTCLEACRKVIDSSGPDLSGVYHDYTILNKETGETIETIIQGPWLTQASITQSIRKKYGIGGGFLAIRGPLARDMEKRGRGLGRYSQNPRRGEIRAGAPVFVPSGQKPHPVRAKFGFTQM